MSATQSFDVVVLGSGPGGYRAAVLAAARGLSAAIIERDAWGGACLNRGCVPKKDWYLSARILAASRSFARRGIRASVAPDPEAAWQHQRTVVATVRESYIDYLDRLGVKRFEGSGRFLDRDRIAVGATLLSAAHYVVATGSRPVIPDSLRNLPRVLTTDDLFERPLPAGRRVALVGGGAVGTEMAFILSMLGFDVQWYCRREPLRAMRFSTAARRRLIESLGSFGIAPRPLERAPEGADWLLAGTGRAPNTNDLGLEAAGVECAADGYVRVDNLQRSSNPRVFAIGDCANRAMTANHALADAAVAVANVLSPGSQRAEGAWVPEVLYSALELALVGATEDELEAAGREYSVGFSAFVTNPAALGEDAPEGYVRILAAEGGGELLGCEIAGAQAGELIHLAQQGPPGEPIAARLARARFNHPSRAEGLGLAGESLLARGGLPHAAE